MMPDNAIHEALNALNGVLWRETAFADLQWYYAEGGVYVLRCKKGDPNEHLCVIRAKSADEAISRAVFDLYKAGEKKKSAPVGNAAAMREALVAILDEKCKQCYINDQICTQGLECHWNGKRAEICQDEAMDKAIAALAAPPRNCDVIPADKLVDEFCNLFMESCEGVDDKKAIEQYRQLFMQIHLQDFLDWIIEPCKTEGEVAK